MSNVKKLMMSAAGGAGINVEEVFSAFRYKGNGGTQTINNGIDLDTEGGLVWIKNCTTGDTNHVLTSQESSAWNSNSSSAEQSGTSYAPTWDNNGNGFYLPQGYILTNGSGDWFNSFTFRNCPNFFQEVRYTGNGTSGRTVSHGLGSVPGMIIVKRTYGVGAPRVYHRSLGATKNLRLSETYNADTNSSMWNNTAPTSSVFTLGNSADVNANNVDYVAYLFAHHNGDGTFGPEGNEDIIKCGSYVGNNAGDYYDAHQIGFKPQFFMIKNIDDSQSWVLWNAEAKWGAYDDAIYPNNGNQEYAAGCEPSGDGVYLKSGSAMVNEVNKNFIYLAIAEGTKIPESPSEVFDTQYVSGTSSSSTTYDFGFSPDLWWRKYNGTYTFYERSHFMWDRYTLTSAYPSNSNWSAPSVSGFDNNNPFNLTNKINLTNYYEYNSSNFNWYDYVIKAAPQFMATVRYRGNGTAGRTVAHNLKAVPEVIWIKFEGSNGWEMYYGDNTKYVSPSYSNAAATSSTRWNNTSPTDTHFTLGTDGGVNANGSYYKAYLFKSLPGLSAMGTYTGNGTSQTITTSLLNTPRFIMIKNLGGNDHWWVYDSNRGIVSGNDPAFRWNTTNDVYSTDAVDPLSNGFSVTSYSGVNSNGYEFFYMCFA